MAELNVQPKKTPYWLWLLLLLILIVLIVLFTRGCNAPVVPAGTAIGDSTGVDSNATAVAATGPDWKSVDFNSPAAKFDEITDTTISVFGNEKYTIYGLGQNILFASDQSTLQGNSSEKLKVISASLNKRFPGAFIGVYGHADSKGDASHNKQLAEDRAVAVRRWLIDNGDIATEKITVQSVGEEKPVATNATPAGRQQNRSVEIVAFITPK